MAIWVDQMRPCRPNRNWRWCESCHLFSDGDIVELHKFARRLGLKRSWFQDRRPHYDLTRRMRERAIRLGAKESIRR